MSSLVEVDAGRVSTITISRPDALNTLTIETLTAFRDGLAEADTTDTKALVVTGAGDESFAAGADIEYMSELDTPEAHRYAELGHEVVNEIESFPVPVVAKINGYAFGGGSEIALACDFRVASENAVIGQTEIDLGIIPGWGGTQRLPRVVGDERARRMIFLGERISADEALEHGFVSEVVSLDELDGCVSSITDALAEKPRFALVAAKEALNLERLHEPEAGLAYERRAWSGLFGTPGQTEGMAAFLKRRDPDFE